MRNAFKTVANRVIPSLETLRIYRDKAYLRARAADGLVELTPEGLEVVQQLLDPSPPAKRQKRDAAALDDTHQQPLGVKDHQKGGLAGLDGGQGPVHPSTTQVPPPGARQQQGAAAAKPPVTSGNGKDAELPHGAGVVGEAKLGGVDASLRQGAGGAVVGSVNG